MAGPLSTSPRRGWAGGWGREAAPGALVGEQFGCRGLLRGVGADSDTNAGLDVRVVLVTLAADPGPTPQRAPLIPSSGHGLPEGRRPSLDSPRRGPWRAPSRPPPAAAGRVVGGVKLHLGLWLAGSSAAARWGRGCSADGEANAGLAGWVVLVTVVADPGPTPQRASLIPRSGHGLPEGRRPSPKPRGGGHGGPPLDLPPPRLRGTLVSSSCTWGSGWRTVRLPRWGRPLGARPAHPGPSGRH